MVFPLPGNNGNVKKVCIVLFIGIFLVSVFMCFFGCDALADETYLRIHIRANSNEKADQEIKLAVRDGVIGYLSPLLSDAKTRKQAERIVLSHQSDLQEFIDEYLLQCGFSYRSAVSVRTERFDERTYGTLTLPEGYYRAVIVDLGTGEGKNWWCVAFPPLCFTLDENYENATYKSFLYEIIRKYLAKEGK